MKREVQFGISIDAAQLTKRLSHVTAGIKVIDKMAKDPETGLRMVKISMKDNGDFHVESGYQSRNNCIPFLIMIAKETNKTYDSEHIKDFVKFLEVIRKEGFKGSLPFNISAGQDMSSIQKTLGKGGGSHTKHFFCHCCQVQRDKRATPNVHKCDSCKNKDVDCYHFKVADANCLEVYAELMSE